MPQSGRRALLILLLLAAQGAAIAQQQTAPPPRITVTGEVKQPGTFDWTPGLTAGQAVALAGGLTDRAMPTWFVHRVEGGFGTTSTVLPDTVLRGGDTVQIGRRPYEAAGPRVNVLGAVKTPGLYTLAAGRTALAITAAGGFADDAGRDVQLWQWRSHVDGPIDVNVNHVDILITHIARGALEHPSEGYVPAPRDDSSAIWIGSASAEAATTAASVSVTGEVRRPGTIRLNEATLRSALVAAGGPTAAAGSIIGINRGNCGGPRASGGRETAFYDDIASGALDVRLCDGDTIDLPRNAVGGVRYRLGPRPAGAPYSSTAESGSIPWAPGLTLDNAIEQIRRHSKELSALGPTAIRVLRRTDDRLAFLTEPNLTLEAKDEILIFPTAPTADVGGAWTVALPDDAAARLNLWVVGTNVTGTLTTHGVTRSLAGELLGSELLLSASAPASGSALALVGFVQGPTVLFGTLDTLLVAADLTYARQTRWQASRTPGTR